MLDAIKLLVKQPFSVVTLLAGIALVALPCVSINRDFYLTTHPPSTQLLVIIGVVMLVLSFVAFGISLWFQRPREVVPPNTDSEVSGVKESEGSLYTTVNGCEIRVVHGRIEDMQVAGAVVVLPCNEYFDDCCVGDAKSALGAFVHRVFDGQSAEFATLLKQECKRQLGDEILQQKTEHERAESFSPGRCLLTLRPLGRAIPIALISTTTQRAGCGLSGRISYLFDGMRELVTRLADARLNEIIMPLLGAGHGRIGGSLALVGLLLAVSEAARYGQGSQRLRRVTIVLLKRDLNSAPQVESHFVRRALALIRLHD